jgi:outer membrane protein assembly factor BamB
MKRKIVLGITLMLLLLGSMDFAAVSFVVLADGSEEGLVDWWSMFHHYANHTGYSTSNVTLPIVSLYNFTTNGIVRSSPAVVDDVVFVGSFDGYVYACNTKMPYSLKKSPDRFGAIYSSLAVVNNVVYFGSDDKNVYALNAVNGEKIWNYSTKGEVKSSPVISDGVLYVGSLDGYVYALNALTGNELWKFWTASSVESSLAVCGNTIVFGTNDGRVYCLNKTGRYEWHFKTNGPVVSSPAVAEGIVFVGSNDTNVYALDATTGELVWNYTTGGAVTSSPAIACGMVFVGSTDGNVYALNATSINLNREERLLWNYTTGGPVWSSPAVSADGKVFIGSCDNKVYAINASSGNPVWNGTTDGPVYSSPAIADGMVFIGSDDKGFYFFGTENKPPVANFTYYPDSPVIFHAITFDASASNDPDGNITAYAWDFGDGTTSNDKIVTHIYETAGTYNVTLTVTDNGGETNSTSLLANVSEAWPMFRHDSSHTGYSTSLSPVTNITLWELRIGPDMSVDPWMYPSAAVVGDEIYIGVTNGTKGGVIFAFYANGTRKWSTGIIGRIFSSPAVVDGLVFIGSEDYYIYALNATTGYPKWSKKSGGPIYSSPVVADDKVFVGSQDTKIFAFNKINGNPLWNRTTGGSIHSSPAIADGKVFIGSADGVYSWYMNGTPVPGWPFKTGEIFDSSPAVAYGRVFIGSDDGYVYALDVANGTVEWKYNLTNRIRSSPAIADGMVFIGSDDDNLYALNATTNNPNGEVIWNKMIGSVRWSSPTVADGKVFIGTTDGKIYALKEKSGDIWWSYQTQTGKPVDSSAAVFNDTLYVSSKDGKLYAFSGEAHDIAITDISSDPQKMVAQNLTAYITVTVENEGSYDETNINITAKYNTTLIYSTHINLTRSKESTLIIPWNTTGIDEGNYTICVNATLDPPINDYEPADNAKCLEITVYTGLYDINVTDAWPGYNVTLPKHRVKTVVGQGYNVSVYVNVTNDGGYSVSDINITVYWSNSTHINQTIGNIIIQKLEKNETKTVKINWNTTGLAKGNYTISVYASPVQGETETEDNTFADGEIMVSIPGDINSDLTVNYLDAILLGNSFNSKPSDHNWTPNEDINNDEIVNYLDAIILGSHFG